MVTPLATVAALRAHMDIPDTLSDSQLTRQLMGGGASGGGAGMVAMRAAGPTTYVFELDGAALGRATAPTMTSEQNRLVRLRVV